MSIANFTDLESRVALWIKRQDLTALIPDFILLAESFLDKQVYVTARRTSYIAIPTSSSFPVPSDCKQPILAYYNGQLLDFFPTPFDSQYAGNPDQFISKGWQIIGNQIQLSVAQLGQKFQLDYYQTLEGLSPTNLSNWLLEDAPDVYLAAVLHEAFSYMRDNDKAVYWLQKRDAAIQNYLDDDNSSRHPAGPLTIRAG